MRVVCPPDEQLQEVDVLCLQALYLCFQVSNFAQGNLHLERRSELAWTATVSGLHPLTLFKSILDADVLAFAGLGLS